MPRCDFACTGCYLGAEANRVPAASMDELRAQLRLLRARLGRGGNLQVTDGEVTLRREEELVALLRAARAEGLIPMVMTHGDSFRRRPGLLERLMREGGLRELGDPVDERDTGAFYARWGGVTFRDVSRAEALGKALGMLVGGAGLLARRLPGFVRHWLRRLDPVHPWRTGLALLRGRARLDWLVFVSHHFMSAAELATPLGQERLALCVFQVPVDGQLRPMCEVNARGLRDAFYARLQQRAQAGRGA